MSRARTLARRSALQALYQWLMAGQNLNDIEEQFLTEQDFKRTDVDYFKELLHEIPKHLDTLEAAFSPYLDRPPEELDPVERSVLRISTYELAHRPDLPYRVIINEGVELAKSFGADQSYKYINGVLDRVAHKLRSVEINAKGH